MYYIFVVSWYFDMFLIFSVLYCWNIAQKGGDTLKKLGTVTVSVFKNEDNQTDFDVETDNDNVLPVSYVIEDMLKFY